MEHVILVDEQDNPVGTMEKIEAHRKSLLHRAFSIFIVCQKENRYSILLQQRAEIKYHCPNLWTNTCCSHPRLRETVIEAGQRRLDEEMGFSVPLRHIGVFQYKAEFANGLTEHEIDHVLLGEYSENMPIEVNSNEVMNYRWVEMQELALDIVQQPEVYTPWLGPALNIVSTDLDKRNKERNTSGCAF